MSVNKSALLRMRKYYSTYQVLVAVIHTRRFSDVEFVKVPTAKTGISPACSAHCGIANFKSPDSASATTRLQRITPNYQQHGAVSQQTSEEIRGSLSGSDGGGERRRWQAVNRGRFADGNHWE